MLGTRVWTWAHRLAAVTLGTAMVTGYAAPASAAVTSAESAGYGAQIDLSVAGLINVNALSLLPGQVSSGIAPAPYDRSASALNLNVDAGIGIGPILGTEVSFDLATATGLLSSSAESNVNGLMGSRYVTAMGQVDGLSLNVAKSLVTAPLLGTTSSTLLGLNATTIASNAQISGDYGSLSATGTSVIKDLSLTVAGATINIPSLLGAYGYIDVNGVLTAEPNTTLLNVGGVANLRLVLNEQIVTGDGVNDLGIEVNAIHLYFDGINLNVPLIDNLLVGDIVLGHSQASLMTVVPEPTSLALGALGLGCLLRRRPRQMN